MNTAMLEEMLGHLAAARDDEAVRVLVLSSNDHLGLSAGADVREELDEAGSVRRMELFAELYDELDRVPEADRRRLPRLGRRRRRRGRGRLRPAGRRREPAHALPGRRARGPVGPARLVTLCGLSIAKYLLLSSRNVSADEALRMGLVHRVAPAARTEEAALELAAEVAEHPPEAVARLKQMLHAGTAWWSARPTRAGARSSGSAPARACPTSAPSRPTPRRGETRSWIRVRRPAHLPT